MRKVWVGVGAAALMMLGGATVAVAGGGPEEGGGAGTADAGPAAVHDTAVESGYTAISPCRIVDTRQAGGALAPSNERSWVAAGTTNFVPQGGKSGGCSIPSAATAIQVSMTATDATGHNGFLRAYPDNVATPNATFMNYTEDFNVTGAGTITLHTAGTPDFKVKNFFQTTHVVIDVQGYFISPMWAHVNSEGALTDGSRVVSTERNFQGNYSVTFDRVVTGCALEATPTGSNQTDIWTDPAGALVVVDLEDPDLAGTQVDDSFFLTVTC